MAMELIYTSAKKGLLPGSEGFCVVAMTHGMPLPLMQRLQSLGGYRPLFDLGSAQVNDNPPSYAHSRINVGGHIYSVLSSVVCSGADHQGRLNKLAHHVVVEANEQPVAGPAWVMLPETNIMCRSWNDEPKYLDPNRLQIPQGTNPRRFCQTWADLSGDAGWAGILAQSFIVDASRPVYVIFQPGMPMLPLIHEAISLVPESDRWRVTFDTYFDTLPPGVSCTWRCCVAGTKAAREAHSYATSGWILDLTKTLGVPPDSEYVRLARGEDGAVDPVQRPSRTALIRAPEQTQAEKTVERDEVELPDPVDMGNAFPERVEEAQPSAPVRQYPESRFGGKWLLLLAIAILWPIVVLLVLWNPFASPDTGYQDSIVRQLRKQVDDLEKKLSARDTELQGYEKQAKEQEAGRHGPASTELARAEDVAPPAKAPVASQEQKQQAVPSKEGKTASSSQPTASAQKEKQPPAEKQTPAGNVFHDDCSLPKMFAGGAMETYNMIQPAEKHLCAAEGATKLKLLLPENKNFTLPKSFRLENARIIWTKPESAMGDPASDVVLGGAEFREGGVWWVWNGETVPDQSAFLKKLNQAIRYSVLKGYDAEDHLRLTCQFVPVREVTLNLNAETEEGEEQTASFSWPRDVLEPIIIDIKSGPNPDFWSWDQNVQYTSDSCSWVFFSTHKAQLTVKLVPVDADKTTVEVFWNEDSKKQQLENNIKNTTKAMEDLKAKRKEDAKWFCDRCNEIFAKAKKKPSYSPQAYEKDLTKAITDCDTWVATRKQEIEEAGGKIKPLKDQLGQIKKECADTIPDVKKRGKTIGEKSKSVKEKLKKIKGKIKELENEKKRLEKIKGLVKKQINKQKTMEKNVEPLRLQLEDVKAKTTLTISIVAPKSRAKICTIDVKVNP